MHFDHDGKCFVADRMADFDGVTILWTERFKEGVQRVHCKRLRMSGEWEYKIVYAKDELTPWGYLLGSASNQ